MQVYSMRGIVAKRIKIGDGREYEATSQHGQPHSSTLGVIGVGGRLAGLMYH